MAELRAGIYQAVASPKQFLWAPFELAIVNIVMASMIMMLSLLVLGITPFVSIIPLVFGHIGLVVAGSRNPHLTTTLQATGKYPPFRRNLARVSKGTKYIP
ncbi:hypothetical protein ACOI1H_16690 [Loktanella sp. DJP18]|uniref:hypothetical protein n=1 Tax=Loktanella sp. DJP18 TaxID=3409788 RepID=UPI003BB67DE3